MTTFDFPSTGDPERDEHEARLILRTDYLLSQNRCPNDATELQRVADGLGAGPGGRGCPRCGFQQYISRMEVE